MRRILPLLMLLALNTAVRAEDVAPPAPPTVEEVARALGSADAKERERGEVLLVRALRAAPDRAALLDALARALRVPEPQSVAPAEPPPAPPAPSAPPAAPAAPAALPAAAPKQEEAGSAIPTPKAKEPTWSLRVWGVSVPERETAPLRKALDDLGVTGAKREADSGLRRVFGAVERTTEWVSAAQRAADAEPLGDATLALADDEALSAHLGSDVVYRCCVEPVKGGSWAVGTGTIEAGLSLRATASKAGLRIEPTWVTVAQPIPTVRLRPALGVDTVELDRPDWSTARTRHDFPLDPDAWAALLMVPGLLPQADRVLVLVLELRRR